MVLQTTLARSSPPVTGPQLDREAQATVCFHPAPADTGVVFVRKDLPEAPPITCRLQHVKVMPRWSSLSCQGIEVHHTEHILAALAGFGVDNVLVEMDCDRIPVVTGGSCLAFSRALVASGRKALEAPRSVFRLKRAIELEAALDIPPGSEAPPRETRRYALGMPADGFSASYLFHVPAVPGLRTGFAEYTEGRDDFLHGAACARTYYLRTEQANLSGLLSSACDDYLVLDGDSSQELVDEVARHKLVDFLGDLRLLGKPLWGRFAAFRTGHRFHQEFIRALVEGDYLETLELTEGDKVS
jgi:UDP-3-O-[3-hydroxymyristoyl] N-acetylglucosamine deacetylase